MQNTSVPRLKGWHCTTCSGLDCITPATIIVATVLLKANVAIDSVSFRNKTEVSIYCQK